MDQDVITTKLQLSTPLYTLKSAELTPKSIPFISFVDLFKRIIVVIRATERRIHCIDQAGTTSIVYLH
jgi:hypothetical protein